MGEVPVISSVSSIYANDNRLLIARKGDTLLTARKEDGVGEYHREMFRERAELYDIEHIVENAYMPGKVLLLHASRLYTLLDVSAPPPSPLHSIKGNNRNGTTRYR